MNKKVIRSLICSALVCLFVTLIVYTVKDNLNAHSISIPVPVEEEPITVQQEELESDDNPFRCAVMVFTPEEAQSLLDRFEEEKRIAEEAARKVAEEAAAREVAAKAAKARAASRANSYHVGAMSYSENDVFMLAVIIGQETAGENEEVMLAVGNVVINRINDSRFPNNMYDVLTGKMQYGRESGNFYFNSYVTTEARERCMNVARRLLNGERVLPANVVWQAGFKQGNGVYAYYDTYPFGTWLCY